MGAINTTTLTYFRCTMIDDDPIAAALSFIHDISPVNHRFKHGWTALHLSAAKGSVAEVKELLASRANFDLHDDDGMMKYILLLIK